MRIIYYRQLVDWASEEANRVQEKILEFIGSESFVQYPDFLKNSSLMKNVKEEWLGNHAYTLAQLTDIYGIEILGARIKDKNVEVLITHHQTQ